MRICILDPGLGGLQGHHFDLDLRLTRALVRRGHDVTVHGFVSPRPELIAAAEAAGMRFDATFRIWAYHTPPDTVSSIDAYRSMAQITAADLAGLPSADLWFWPSLVSYQFMAAVEQQRPIRQLGGIWFLSRRWAHAARVTEAEVQAPIVVGAYDELLCQAYRTSWPGLPPVVRLPCPHDGAPSDHRPTALRRIGFFGHQRASRGLDLLPQLVSDLLERGFEVVVQDSGHAIFRQDDNPRLIVLPFVADFPAQIARCDLVIWPSRIQAYLQSHSGIVSECIASGVPVILPSGCLPADVAARFETGVYFSEFSREAILEAVNKVQQAYPAVAARARAAAPKWHAENGTDRLIDWIVDKYGGST